MGGGGEEDERKRGSETNETAKADREREAQPAIPSATDAPQAADGQGGGEEDERKRGSETNETAKADSEREAQPATEIGTSTSVREEETENAEAENEVIELAAKLCVSVSEAQDLYVLQDQ